MNEIKNSVINYLSNVNKFLDNVCTSHINIVAEIFGEIWSYDDNTNLTLIKLSDHKNLNFRWCLRSDGDSVEFSSSDIDILSWDIMQNEVTKETYYYFSTNQ